MKRNTLVILLPALFVTLMVGGLIIYLAPRLNQLEFLIPRSRGSIGLTSDAVVARVVEIVEEGNVTLGKHAQPYQILRVQLLDGPYKGRQIVIDYGQRQIRPAGYNFQIGDQILVTVGEQPDGKITA